MAAVLIVQLALVASAFPLSELGTETPLFRIDNAVHWYRIKCTVNLVADGVSRGYDPFFAAGAARVTSDMVASKIPALLTIHASLSELEALKWFAVLSGLIGVLCVPVGAALLGWNWKQVALGALFGLILWWVSMFRWFHTAGMVSFVLAAYLSFPYLCGIVRYLEGRGGGICIATLCVVGAFGFYCHPHFPVAVVLGTVAALFMLHGRWTWRRTTLLLTVVPLISVLPHLHWIIPGTVSRGADVAYDLPHQRIVDPNLIWKEMLGVWGDGAAGSRLNPALVLLSMWALLTTRAQERRRVRVFAVLALVLIVFAALGASVELFGRLFQPNRFAPVGYLFLVIPAVAGAHSAWAQARRASSRSAHLSAISCLLAAAAVTLYCTIEVRREARVHEETGHYGAAPPQVRELGPVSRWTLDWLERSTKPTGRILFETANGRVHDGCHIAGYCAYVSEREFIGGPYPYSSFAGYWDGFLFGRPIEDIPAGELEGYLELYNIGWILVHNPKSKRVFDRLTGVASTAQHGPLNAYRVLRAHSFFERGAGRVESRTHNALQLADLSGTEIVLRYHYVPGLQCEPSAEIEPIRLMDDPVPFVRICNPPPRLRLYLR